MKNNVLKKLIFAAIVLFCATLLFSSCNDETKPDDRPKNDEGYFDDLPSDLDFDGETVTIVHWDNAFVNRELTADNTQNDALDKAVIERNRSVEERLGIKLDFKAGNIAPEYYMPILQEEILSGDVDYDIVSGVQCQTGALCVNGCYSDLSEAKYIDINKSYWNSDYIKELKIGPTRFYMLGGDISLTTTAWASTMLYNTTLYTSLFGSTDNLYTEIINGEWTLDNFFEKCRGAYLDVNGNGQTDESDRFGLGLQTTGSIIDMFCFSSGVEFTQRDKDNYPVLDVDNEQTIEFTEKFNNAISNNPGIWAFTSENLPEKYIDSLFEATTMDAISTSTRNSDEIGVIPYPKLNKNERIYHSWISDNTLVYSIPITVKEDRKDMICATLEAMASETRRICLPAYYETALKDKYTRDENARTMLDLIHDGATADFTSIYSEQLAGIGTIMRQQIGYGNDDFENNYFYIANDAAKALKKMIETYEINTSDDPTAIDTTTESDDDTTEINVIPVDSLTADFKADNTISDEWDVLAGKYRSSGILIKNDITSEYSYKYENDGSISVMSAPESVRGGLFPTAAIVSKKKVNLGGLNVTFRAGEGFGFKNAGYSSSFSFVWTTKPIDSLPEYTDQIGTNGLRECVPDDAYALAVVFMGTKETDRAMSDLMYIIMFDATGAAPEIDHRIGYRWCMNVNTDLSQDVNISVKKDDILGFVISVNDVEYREGVRGNQTLPIDLVPLREARRGHICVGAESTGNDMFASFELKTINNKNAKEYFENRQ